MSEDRTTDHRAGRDDAGDAERDMPNAHGEAPRGAGDDPSADWVEDSLFDDRLVDDMLGEDDEPIWYDTIGIFGGRSSAASRYQITRAKKTARLAEILRIASHYDIFRGLTPLTFRKLLEELGPTFVKAGQILSMRSEILPESFCHELTRLRSNVEPMDRELVLETLRAEYREPIEDIFDAIDDVPLGSASVAQVHKARLATGELVAVKVQRPHVQEIMAQDISIMRSLARRASRFIGDAQFLDLQSVVDELWQSFREETDFLVEAHSLEEFRRNNADCAYVTCPKPYIKLCTEHVVVMDYVEGISIGDTRKLSSLGYDLGDIGRKLVDNYASQMLDEGFFHADPHPGNLLVSGGKIVYMDLGIMGRLSSHDRAALTEMVEAVALRDAARLKSGLLRFSVSDVSDVDHPGLLADLDGIIADFGEADLCDLDLSAFMNALISMARKNGIELPGTVTMLARSLVTLEGVVDELLPGTSIVEIVREHIKAHSDLADSAKAEARRLSRASLAATRGLLDAAAQSSTAMNMLTRGQLRMNLDLVGYEDPVGDLARSADRLTMGIVIAGLFIGSSVVYYARIKPVIFGVPVIGFVGYVVAFLMGVWLVRSIMSEGKRRR
ncbi:ABC1 kinase family protein [Parafannyhessea umbonata]|uniref:Ubiquinone biosynthesis protein n=1 Tax=Parafannyhessea umbonata TaxID=604330 RepID=A0A1H9NCL6_9ACTN|nr:AarF/UbiB family protein [Parafannyhessea umbonata]SER33780.1 ubiquinone biosynthesis protein [Parafannyhessea umbonata]